MVSSKWTEAMKTISSLFTFFFTKRFRPYKNVCMQTLANKTKNKRAKNNKSSGFLHAQASKRVKVTWFAFCAFCTREIFLQKEENK